MSLFFCCFFSEHEMRHLLIACLSCDISLPSLGRQLCENNHTIHLAVLCLLPKHGWPHFSSSPSFLFSLAFRPSLFFFLSFPGVSHSGQGSSIFPQSMVVKTEPLFPATGKEGGGGRLTSWLQTLVLCQCEKKTGKTDLMMTEQLFL